MRSGQKIKSRREVRTTHIPIKENTEADKMKKETILKKLENLLHLFNMSCSEKKELIPITEW